MKNSSINKKIFFIVTLFSAIFLVVGFGISSYFIGQIEDDIYQKTKQKLEGITNQKEMAKTNIGLTNAISIANDKNLAQALQENDRLKAKDVFVNLGDRFKQDTKFGNIKVHVHTKDVKSFLRDWDFDKFGDDLSQLRPSIVDVNANKKSISTIEVGKDGLLFRGVAPIFSDGVHLGSVEFVQGFESTIKSLKAEYDYDLMILVNKQVTQVADKLDTSKPIGEYYVSQQTIEAPFYEEAKKINIEKLKKDGFYVGNNYFFTYKSINHYKNGEQGIYLVGEKLSKVRQTVANAEKIVYAFVVLIVVLIAVLLIIFMISLNKYVLNPLSSLQNVLQSFFDFLNRKRDKVDTLDIKDYDEIGSMIAQINENIIYTRDSYQKDINLIAEVSDVIEKVDNGFYTYSVKGSTNNPQIETLKNSLNRMIKGTNEKLNKVSNALQQYGLSKFDHKMDMNGMYGNFGSVAASTKLLGNNVSELLSMILNTGDKLDKSTSVLSKSSESLSSSANQQASSLEETAASLEEISSNIRHTVEQSQEMAKLAQDTMQSANKGSILSSQTAKAMDEINQSTTAINDAITVIDQIAFQTNILSLNAAVEAATAGEAGKGFAVVAQEVRNLANRSSDAAKEIKNLVELAKSRTNEGKLISDQMKSGFDELNEKITKTSSLVANVATASKEQLSGVNQINDALSQLDQDTQENARVAHQISLLASEVSNMANALVSASSKAQFNQEAREQVCDIDLVYDTAKLKLDHVILKEKAFANLDTKSNSKIIEHSNCDLGRWISNQSNKAFASGNSWNDFLVVHKQVHENIQKYLDANARGANNNELRDIAKAIETDTIKVFDYLNEIKRVNCKTQDIKSDNSISVHKTNENKQKIEIEKISKPTQHAHVSHDDKWDTF